MVTTSALVRFLKSKNVSTGFVDQLKVNFRPLISPFDDLINQLQNTTSVFDIGCGSGQFALLLAEFTKVQKIGGVEINNNLVNNASSLLNPYQHKIKFSFQVYDGEQIPNLSDYEVVLLIDVLHHVPKHNQPEFIVNIYKAMAPGTRLIIKDIDAGSWLVYFNKLHDLIFAKEIGNEWSLENLKSFVTQTGFRILEVQKKLIYVYPHFTLTLEK
ncbi:MAG: class I SAM-dependent methyltransferase [Cyclobacteriaceae bacterium]|nr:class I SAM-dependent methyltransferase [Cyclobacteriaceae bacterium]